MKSIFLPSQIENIQIEYIFENQFQINIVIVKQYMNQSKQNRARIFQDPPQQDSNRQSLPTQTQRLPEASSVPHPNNLQQSHFEQPLIPNKQKPILYYANLQSPRVFCHYHPDQVIHNFCKNLYSSCQIRDCLMPLCPVCVKIHQQEHIEEMGSQQIPQFELLETCLQEQYNKIVEICNHQTDDIQNLVEFKNDIRNHRDIQRRKFQEAKEQYFRTIEQHFQKLELELNNRSVNNIDQLLNETNTQHKLIYELWESFQRKLNKLNSEKCLKTLIKSYKISKPEVKFQTSHDFVQNFLHAKKAEMPSIIVQPEKLQDVLNSTNLYMIIQTPPVVKETVIPQSALQAQQPLPVMVQPQQQHPLIAHQQQPTRILSSYPIYTSPHKSFQSRVFPGPQPINHMPVVPQVIPPQVFTPQVLPPPMPMQMIPTAGIAHFPVNYQAQVPLQSSNIPPPSAPGVVINLNGSPQKLTPMAQKYHEHFNTILQNPSKFILEIDQPFTTSNNKENPYEFSPTIK